MKLPEDYVWNRLPPGDREPIFKYTRSESEHDAMLGHILGDYISHGFPQDSIVVISCLSGGRAAVQEKYCRRSVPTLSQFTFSYLNEASDGLTIACVDDFRGLESMVVVVSDVSESNTFRANYMAATRAQAYLSIVYISPRSNKSMDTQLGNELSFDL